jgi:hypothetical protein
MDAVERLQFNIYNLKAVRGFLDALSLAVTTYRTSTVFHAVVVVPGVVAMVVETHGPMAGFVLDDGYQFVSHRNCGSMLHWCFYVDIRGLFNPGSVLQNGAFPLSVISSENQ